MAVVKVNRPQLAWHEKIFVPALIKGLLITFGHGIRAITGKTVGAKSLNSSGLGATMQYPEQKWDDQLPEYYRGVLEELLVESEAERPAAEEDRHDEG